MRWRDASRWSFGIGLAKDPPALRFQVALGATAELPPFTRAACLTPPSGFIAQFYVLRGKLEKSRGMFASTLYSQNK